MEVDEKPDEEVESPVFARLAARPAAASGERSVCLGYWVSRCTTRRRDMQWTKGLSSDVCDKGLIGNEGVTMAFYGP